MTKSTSVPAAMQEKFSAIAQATDAFCDQYLNDQYKLLIRQALAALCRKRPSPLQSGKANSWAAGAVHALGMANFLFDATQTPHCKAQQIYGHFGLGASTVSNHSKKIRDALDMGRMDPNWTLPDRMDDNPLAWMVKANGFIVDARQLPLEAQEIAFAKGLIPYVPAHKKD
ncbi:MAG: DUF6398 domain-containing protein [Rhodoferax sp.]